MQTPSKEGHKLPMLTPKNPDGSQRVIKQIMVIDPNKLRVAGLDLKMAEALKKAKGKISTSSNSKDTKLAIAKGLISKKLRQAQIAKDSNKPTKHVAPQQSSNATSIEKTAPKPQIKVANLKTLMPPPPPPAPAPLLSQPHTVLLSFLKSNKSDVLKTSLDSTKTNTPAQIPKASTRKLSEQQNPKTQSKALASKVISPEVKFEMKKPKEVESVVSKIIEVKVLQPNGETFCMPLSPRKHRPKVLESKVLSPEEKIDLSTLRVKASSILIPLVPSTNPPIKHTNAISKCLVAEAPPASHPPMDVPPKPVVESAVDFINNLSFMIKSKSDSNSKNEYGEDATSFLMSLFEEQPTKTQSNLPDSSKMKGSFEQSTPSLINEEKQSQMPECTKDMASDGAVREDATSEKLPFFGEMNQQTVAIKKISTVSGPPIGQPPQTVENVVNTYLAVRSPEIHIENSSTHIATSSQNNETVDQNKTDPVIASSLVGGSEKEKKGLVEDILTISHQKDSSPSLPSETDLSTSKDKPSAEETPSSTTSAANTRRKSRKSVPVLITKLNKSRKTPTFQEKLPEQVEEISKTEDKLSEKVEKVSELPSEPPPQEQQSPLENDSKEETKPTSASTTTANIRRRSTKSLPIVIAKLNETRKPPTIHQKFPKKVEEGTHATEEIQSEQSKVAEVIQKPSLGITLCETQQKQSEVSMSAYRNAPDPNINEQVDQFSKSAGESEEKLTITGMTSLTRKSESKTKNVLIPSHRNSSTSEPSPELRNPVADVVSIGPTASKSRKISERSKTARSEPNAGTTQKEPAEEAASVAPLEIASTPRKHLKLPKETPNVKNTTKSLDAAEVKPDSKDLPIQKPSERSSSQDGKEEGVDDSFSRKGSTAKVTDTSHTSTAVDSRYELKSLETEKLCEPTEQEEQKLEKSTEADPLEMAEMACCSSRSGKGTSNTVVKSSEVSHIAGSTESLPATVDQKKSFQETEIAKTSFRSRKSQERSKSAKTTPNLENTNQSFDTSHTRVAKLEISSTSIPSIATVEVTDTENEMPDTPVPSNTRKSRSKSKSTAGISSDKTTKIINIVTKELLRQNASNTESAENLVQTALAPGKPRSQRSTTAKGSKGTKDKFNSTTAVNTLPDDRSENKTIEDDDLKERADPVPTTSTTRRRTKTKPNEELATESVAKPAEVLRDPSNLAVHVSETIKSKSDVLQKSKTSRGRKISKNSEKEANECTISAVNEIQQTLIDNSKSKEASRHKISPQAQLPESLQTNFIISGKRGKRKSKVAEETQSYSSTTNIAPQSDNLFDNLRNEQGAVSPSVPASLPTDNSPRISVDSHGFEDCDPDLSMTIVTTAEETLKIDADQPHSTPKQRTAKNLFKKESQETEKKQKEETSFFGFNEQEIKEGQQSTCLRLSQSEEVVPLKSPSQRGSKKKRSPAIKSSGKKQKTEQKNWKKNSSASLRNWLTTAVKCTKGADEKVQPETNEINSSIPLKKRRGRKQNLDESIKLEVNDPPQVDCPVQSGDTSGRGKRRKEASGATENNIGTNTELDDPKTSTKLNQRKRTPLSAKKNVSKAKESSSTYKPEDNAKQRIDDVKPINEPNPNKRKRSPETEDISATEPPAKISHLLPGVPPSSTPRRSRGRPAKLGAAHPHTPKPIYKRLSPVNPLQKKYKNDTEFNPRLLLITQKEELKNDDPLIDPDLQTEPKNNDDLQCALCMGYTTKKKWLQHISGHYGVGWVVGTSPPLNVKSRASVLNYMVEFFKNTRVKGLNCRICKRQRRSALGLLIHLEQCCLTVDELKESRVVCEHCNHEYSKSSIVIHLRTCTELLKKTKAEEKVQPKSVDNVGGGEDNISNTGRLKRKSVIKAENNFKNQDDSEFIPDELIKRIPPRRTDLYTSTWQLQIESFGKGFCVEKKCQFTAATVDELVEHCQIGVCLFMEKVGYICMKCKFHANDIASCRSHVVEKHSPQLVADFDCSDDDAEFGSESSSDSISSGVEEHENEKDGSTDTEKQKRKRRKKTTRKRNRIKIPQSQKDFKKLLPDREIDIWHRVRKWHEKFIKDHYSAEPLFTFATPSAIQTDKGDYEPYFPKSPISMKFVLGGFKGFVKEFGKSQIAPEKWQTLERLKGTGLAKEHAAYVGGPVKSIAWAPLEPHPASKTQYLAIATRKAIEKFSRFTQPKQNRVLVCIQKYQIDGENVISGDIHYAFPIDAGPVHCLEFLPSGGYAPHMNRLGLVAVATVATEVKIYSLPLEVEKRECDIFPIIRLKPSFELCLEVTDGPSKYAEQYQSQCMSIGWSQTAGHNYIIGGFLNGFVAIWDISEEDDNLNRILVNGLRKFVPVTYFWTMDNRIKHVVPHYDMNGLRWLGICNQNRKVLLYDLREITKPILFYADTTKNICNSLDWPIVWENPSCGHGDAMPSHGKCINTISPMNLVFVSRRFDKFCCGVNDISFNPWRNQYAGAGDNGDINVTPLREAVLDVSLRMKIDEKTISTLDIVSLDGGVVPKKLSDGIGLLEPDYKQKYGLVFGVPQRIVGSKHREMYAEKRIPPLNIARLMRVNRLRFNPNRSANSLLAVGYENGFVRVIQSDWHKTLKDIQVEPC